MQPFRTLVRRELGAYFNVMTGYAIIASVLLLVGWVLVDILYKTNGLVAAAPLTQVFFSTFTFWLVLLPTAPVITMRSFAAERSSGTYETLMTAPVSDLLVVLAKFTGALLVYLLTWLPMLGCLAVVRYYTGEAKLFEVRTAVTTFLGMGLIGSLYMALGCLASALTRSQVLAAMNAFVFGLTLFLLSLREMMAAPATDFWGRVFGYMAMGTHMEDFARGIIDTRHVIFYLSLTVFFLYLTLKVVESRRWK